MIGPLLLAGAVWAADPEEAPEEVVGVYRKSAPAVLSHELDPEDLRVLPGTLGDPLRAASALTPVMRTPFDAGWLLVRGGRPGETGTTIDGVTVPAIYHLGGFTTVVHPAAFAALELAPGAPPAQIPDALAGNVDLTLAGAPKQTRIGGGANLAFADAFADVALPGKRGLFLSARRSYLDGVLTAVLGRERAQIAPAFWDGMALYRDPHWSILGLAVSDRAHVPAGVDQDVIDVGRDAAQAQVRYQTKSGKWKLRAMGWVTASQQRYRAPDQDERIEDFGPGLRLSAAWTASGVTAAGGLDVEVRRWSVTRDRQARAAPMGLAAPWGEVTFVGPVEARLGVRLDGRWVVGQPARFGPSPRAALRIPLPGHLAIEADGGVFHALPSRALLIGTPDGSYLPDARATAGSIGAGYENLGFRLHLAGYVRHTDRLSTFERDGSLGPSDALAYGVEAEWSLSRGPIDAATSLVLSRSLAREDPGNLWISDRYDLPVYLRSSVVAHLPSRWTAAARFRLSSGYSRTDGAETAYDLLTQRDEALEIDRHGRLPIFYALDVKATKRWVKGRVTVDASLDVQNLTNRRVPEPIINGIDDTQAVYGFGLPVLPIFGVEVAGRAGGKTKSSVRD